MTIYPDARELCGEVLEFKTKAHKRHVCISGAPHSKEKHRCVCGVKWTTDPELGNKPEHGEKWSEEKVIYQQPGPSDIPFHGGRIEPFSDQFQLDPTKNYDRDNDKKENHN